MEQLRVEPRLEPKPPKAVHTCSWCDEPIYDGEEAYNMAPYGWCCEWCMTSRLTIAREDEE